MRRASILVSVVIAVLLGAVAVGRLGTPAQDGTPAAPAGQGFVGSWRIAASSRTGQQVAALASMTSDRIFLDADAPVVAAAGAS